MRLWRFPVALLAVLTAVLIPLLSRSLAPVVRADPGPPVSCQELRDRGFAVSLSDRDLGGDDTHLCVVARMEDDTYIAFLPNVATADDFRTAKQIYAAAIVNAGYDVCRISVWRPLNREGGPDVTLSAADQLDLPVTCAPRVVARDQGAAAWVAPVQQALGPLIDQATTDLGFTPHRPLTIDLYTDAAALTAAVQTAGRATGRPIDEDAARRITDGGRSLTALTPTRGVFILLNLTHDPSSEEVRRRLAHEYTHFIQSAAGGTLDAYPLWFLEGQAEYEMERLSGAARERRTEAARMELDGSAPRLSDLVKPDGWSAAEARNGSAAVYSLAYSAVAYLADRWGFDATTRLLLAGSDVDPARFDRVFADITGLDLDGFDVALGSWLRALPGHVTFYNDSPLAQELLLSDGRSFELPACATCTFLKPLSSCTQDGRPSVSFDLPPGDQQLLRVVPDDRVHFPDTTMALRVDPAGAQTQCLALRVG